MGIPSSPLALFIVMLPKAHLTSHSRMSGSRSVITPWSVNGNPFQHSCLENPMYRGAWSTLVYGVPKSGTQLSMHHEMTFKHDYWRTISLTIWTIVSKLISLLFNILSRLVITFIPRSNHLLGFVIAQLKCHHLH